VDGVAYSVPHRLIGAVVDVHAGPAVIQVFHRGDRVACHRRRVAGEDPRAGGDRVTLDAHKPANHKAMADYTPDVAGQCRDAVRRHPDLRVVALA